MTQPLKYELVTIMRDHALALKDTAEIGTAIRLAMAPALDGYRALPVVVEQTPWLSE